MLNILQRGKETINTEIEGLQALVQSLDCEFEKAVELLYFCKGKVIITGMGKSGLIGRKIASTMTSTGTPAVFLHPAESSHGDLGIVTPEDVVIVISFSGETTEVVEILGNLQALGISIISITGKPNSTLAKNATIHLDIGVEKEACPLGLAPTTSTTVTLALGDALSMCLLEKRNFKEEDFAVFHPGGSLGKKLTVKVYDLMIKGERLPIINNSELMKKVVKVLSEKMLGIVAIVDDNGILNGVFTVGDLMRLVENGKDFLTKPVKKFMVSNPKVTSSDILAAKALYIMETHSITCLVVVDTNKKPVGILQIYDILRAGVF